MRNFILGIVVTILVLADRRPGLALLGFIPTNANTTPPKMERQIAMSALDDSVERHAPRVNNPVPPTDENLIEGIKIYTMNCARCHGGIDRKPVELGHGRSIPRLPTLFFILPMIRNGTSSMPFAPGSATPACRPGKRTSPRPTSGRLQPFSLGWRNYRPLFRTTGKNPAAPILPPRVRKDTTTNRNQLMNRFGWRNGAGSFSRAGMPGAPPAS